MLTYPDYSRGMTNAYIMTISYAMFYVPHITSY